MGILNHCMHSFFLLNFASFQRLAQIWIWSNVRNAPTLYLNCHMNDDLILSSNEIKNKRCRKNEKPNEHDTTWNGLQITMNSQFLCSFRTPISISTRKRIALLILYEFMVFMVDIYDVCWDKERKKKSPIIYCLARLGYQLTVSLYLFRFPLSLFWTFTRSALVQLSCFALLVVQMFLGVLIIRNFCINCVEKYHKIVLNMESSENQCLLGALL